MFLLKITTNSGIVGFGCAAPDFEVTGETEESVLEVAKDVIEPMLKGSDPLRYSYQLNKLTEPLKNHPSALAMIDMAFLILWAKKQIYQFINYLVDLEKKLKPV